MSVDKLVDSTQLDADLTSVANAIRTKGGTSAQLAFPAGFVSAVAALPSGGGGMLPNEYAEAEYIESDRNSYINTNYYVNPNTFILCDYTSLKESGESFECLFGVATSQDTNSDPPNCYMYIGAANTLNALMSKTVASAVNTNTTINKNSRQLLIMGKTMAGTAGGNMIDPKGDRGSELDSTIAYPLYLFARNHSDSLIRAYAKGRMHRFQIAESGTLIRDFVPACRKADGEYGLYETYQGIFYTNQGSGEFTGSLTAASTLSVLTGD